MKQKKIESFYTSPQISYSFAFKQKVVKEVESGAISKDGARRKYGIGGKTTVLNWCRQYGNTYKKEYSIMKVTPEDINKEQLAKEKMKELESALAEAHLKIRSQEILLDIGRDKFGLDLRKKHVTKHQNK